MLEGMETWQATALTAIGIVLSLLWGKPLVSKFGSFDFSKLLSFTKPKESVTDEVAEWTQARDALKRLELDADAKPILEAWRAKIACGLMCLEGGEVSDAK